MNSKEKAMREEFQFLIGRLKTVDTMKIFKKVNGFQFLIGRLKTTE